MRVALLLPLLSACARPPAPGTTGRQYRPEPEPAPARSAEATQDRVVPAAVAPVDAAVSLSAPDVTVPDFTIEAPRTQVWIATVSGCKRFWFQPRDATSGSILVGGVSIRYTQQGDMLDLGYASRSDGDGLVTRRCRTGLRLGPGKTLGGATVFDDEASCTAAHGTAPTLDDSAEATLAKCRGEVLAVTTDEIECGVGERYALAGRPGCIGVALGGIPY